MHKRRSASISLDIVHDLEKISDHCSNIAIYTVASLARAPRSSIRMNTPRRATGPRRNSRKGCAIISRNT